MESIWLLIILFFLPLLFFFIKTKRKNNRLPPGPLPFPIIGNLLWLYHPLSDLESVLHGLHKKYGPIITLRAGSRLMVIINDRNIAHTALITHGAIFAGRPELPTHRKILTANGCNITSSQGPLWRLLRRNLVGEALHPSRVQLFSPSRKWVLGVLVEKLKNCDDSKGGSIMECFQFGMFCLLVYMCFGERLDESYVKAIGTSQRDLLLYGNKLSVFAFMPALTKYLYRGRWNTVMNMSRRRNELHNPLLEARKKLAKNKGVELEEKKEVLTYCYVDTLLGIKLPEEGERSLSDDEIHVLCSEFLNAGTDTTATGLQWIMAELTKNPDVQLKLQKEIRQVLAENNECDDEVKEELLEKMPYLKAVVLEGLRRHPPAHFVLFHAVTEEITINGYVIPKNAWVNFTVAKMGMDEEVWENPDEFKPERFLRGGEGENVDITGTKEIKMMPFGVGRRICAALGLAMLHLEYFVANLVNEFEWREIEGEEVDLAEKDEFTVVMKNPLKARLVPRKNIHV